MFSKALIHKMVKMVRTYYPAYKTAKEMGDLELEATLEARIEEILKDLVRCFETEKMYEYEDNLKYFGIHKGAGEDDYVSEILGDIEKLMEESE